MKYVRRWRSHGTAEASSHAFHIRLALFSLSLCICLKVGPSSSSPRWICVIHTHCTLYRQKNEQKAFQLNKSNCENGRSVGRPVAVRHVTIPSPNYTGRKIGLNAAGNTWCEYCKHNSVYKTCTSLIVSLCYKPG